MTQSETPRFLFILSYGRSGSTLLSRILNEVPKVEIRGENRNALFKLWKAICSINETSESFGAYKRSIDDPWYGADAVAPEAFKTQILEAFIQDVLAPPPGTEVLGFKEISHLPNQMSEEDFRGYVDFILAHFPGAQIILNTRDAASVCKSGWFKEMDPDYVMGEVREADRRFHALAAANPQCHVIDYSNVVAADEKLYALFRAVGIDYESGKVEEILARPLTHMKGPNLVKWGRRAAKKLLVGRTGS